MLRPPRLRRHAARYVEPGAFEMIEAENFLFNARASAILIRVSLANRQGSRLSARALAALPLARDTMRDKRRHIVQSLDVPASSDRRIDLYGCQYAGLIAEFRGKLRVT